MKTELQNTISKYIEQLMAAKIRGGYTMEQSRRKHNKQQAPDT